MDYTADPTNPLLPADSAAADGLDDELRAYKLHMRQFVLLPDGTNKTGLGQFALVADRANKLVYFDPDTGQPRTASFTYNDLSRTLTTLKDALL
jgi:hypothetical protein